MTVPSHLFNLLAHIKTKAYAEEVVRKLDELSNSLFNKRVNLDQKTSELFSFELKEKILAYFAQEQANLNDPMSFGKFLDKLREYIKNLPIVSISVPIEPNDELAREVSSWFINHFGKNVLIDLVLDKTLVAGTIISFNGVQKDFSMRKELDEKFSEEDWRRLVAKIRQVRVRRSSSQVSVGQNTATAVYQTV